MKRKNLKQRIVVFALLLSIINLVIAIKLFYSILYFADENYFPIITVTIMQIINIIISARLILKKQNISPKKEKILIIILLILLFITFFIPVTVETKSLSNIKFNTSKGFTVSLEPDVIPNELHKNIYNFVIWSMYDGIFYYFK